MRKNLSLILVGPALLIVPSIASAAVVKDDHPEFARAVVGERRDVNVAHGDALIGPGGSVTVGQVANLEHPEHPPAVPEPATWAMMLLGFGVVGFAMRRGRTERPRQVA